MTADPPMLLWTFEERVEVLGVEDGTRMSLSTPDLAVHGLAQGSHVHARLVWANPDAATPVDDESA